MEVSMHSTDLCSIVASMALVRSEMEAQSRPGVAVLLPDQLIPPLLHIRARTAGVGVFPLFWWHSVLRQDLAPLIVKVLPPVHARLPDVRASSSGWMDGGREGGRKGGGACGECCEHLPDALALFGGGG
eukprot:2426015-Rhodomonas_salina.3